MKLIIPSETLSSTNIMGVPTPDPELEMYGFEIWRGNTRFSKIKLLWVTFL
jgi:hypothetical protein